MALVLSSNNDDLSFVFGKIQRILLFDSIPNYPVFNCKHYNNLGLNDHVAAYEIEETEEKVCVEAINLLHPWPVYVEHHG